MKILVVHNFTWDSMPAKLAEAQRITRLAPIDPISFYPLKQTYAPIEVEDGRITHAYFDTHFGDYARLNGYQGVIIALTRYQANVLKLESGLRGAYQNDHDALMEGWIVADEDDLVIIPDGMQITYVDALGVAHRKDVPVSIIQFIKTLCHELGHGLCDWYGVPDTVHNYDFKRERIDIEGFYRNFKPKSGRAFVIRSVLESLGVLRRRIHRSLPIPPFNWTQITQAYLEPDKATYPRTGLHPGTDFRGKVGDPIFAPIDGELTRTGKTPELGFWLEYRMGDEYLVAVHLKSEAKKGHYKRGERIGTLGDTGKQTAPHYHLEGWYKPMDRSLLTSAAALKKLTFDIKKHIG